MGGLADRPTADLIVLITATVFALVALLAGAGIFLVILYVPDRDMTPAISAYGNYLGTLLGAFLGFAAGRRSRPGPWPPPDHAPESSP